jgi:hypothetical protein
VPSAMVSNDGFVYFADRGNCRVQIFTIDHSAALGSQST